MISRPWGRREFVGVVAAALGCTPRGSTKAPVDADGTFVIGDGPSFAALVKGHVVVVDFWATWCEPCRESIPKVIDYARRVAPSGVVVVGVHVGDGHEDARRFAAEAGIDYPLFADPEYRLSGAFGASRVPTVVVLGRNGEVVARAAHVDATIEAAVASAIAAPPSS